MTCSRRSTTCSRFSPTKKWTTRSARRRMRKQRPKVERGAPRAFSNIVSRFRVGSPFASDPRQAVDPAGRFSTRYPPPSARYFSLMNDAETIDLPARTEPGEVGLVEPRDFVSIESFLFESGQTLPGFTLRYETYGRL